MTIEDADPGFHALPARLRYLQKWARKNAEEMAEFIGCHVTFYYQVRAGTRWPREARHVAKIEQLSKDTKLPHGPIRASHWAEAERIAIEEELAALGVSK